MQFVEIDSDDGSDEETSLDVREAELKPVGHKTVSKPSARPTSATKESTTKVKKEAPVSVGSPDIVLLSTSDVDGLPEFACAAWSTSFLPTLYNSLGCAPKPWDLPGDGSDMVKFVQEILDTVYPGTGYWVKLNDRIFSMVNEFYFEFQLTY
jgi:hypothetical protein